MAPDDELEDYSHIQGHFDPMVLATFQSHGKTGGRGLDKFDVHHVQIGEGRQEEAVDVEAALVHLTGRHEQDHFARHASSELGLFLSLLLQLRSHAHLTASKARDEVNRRLAGEISFVTTKLAKLLFWGESTKEKNAVRLVNTVMSLFEGSEVLVAEEPDREACPNGLGYIHFLEASAVLNEYGICEALQVPREQWDDLLRTDARDEQLYFHIAHESLRVCRGVIPLAIMLVRKALDSRIPVLGSPQQDPIAWHLFAPEARWIQMSSQLEHAMRSASVEQIMKLGKDYLRLEDTQQMMLGAMEAFDAEFGWHGRSEPVLRHEVSVDAWRTRFSASGAKVLEALLRNTEPILEHLCESFRTFRKCREEDPVASYSNFFLVAGDSGAEPGAAVSDRRVNLAAYPLFTVRDRRINSHYFEEKASAVWTAISYYVHSLCQAAEVSGVPKSSFGREVLSFLSPEDPCYERLSDMVQRYVDGSLFREVP